MIFTLILLIAFALPYVAKVGFWSTVNEGQEYTQGALEQIRLRAESAGIDDKTIGAIGLSGDAETNLSRCLNVSCKPTPVWQLVLGVDKGPVFWIAAVALIIYNVLRAALTYIVAPMREEEERSGYSPAWFGEKFWHGYRPLYYAHRLVLGLAVLATVAFLVNPHHWLSKSVWLPAPTEISQLCLMQNAGVSDVWRQFSWPVRTK